MSLNVEKFVDGLHRYLAKQFAPLIRRIEVLESAQGRDPQIKFAGEFQLGQPYRQGNAVSFAEYTWLCTKNTSDPPGDNDSWTLCC